MGVAEIQERLNVVYANINNLEASKAAYQSIDPEIYNAINEFKKARKSVEEAYTLLENYYISDIATKKINKLKSEYTNIDNIISKLETEILAKVEEQISTISGNIGNLYNEITLLNLELDSRRLIE